MELTIAISKIKLQSKPISATSQAGSNVVQAYQEQRQQKAVQRRQHEMLRRNLTNRLFNPY